MIDFQKKISQLNSKTLLRFFTCGSVDDGKSTLIGRLLYDCNMLSESQLTQLKEDSKKSKYASGKIDFSLLVDGLNAEREQGITISDVSIFLILIKEILLLRIPLVMNNTLVIWSLELLLVIWH